VIRRVITEGQREREEASILANKDIIIVSTGERERERGRKVIINP
jgi:hypothetical protein